MRRRTRYAPKLLFNHQDHLARTRDLPSSDPDAPEPNESSTTTFDFTLPATWSPSSGIPLVMDRHFSQTHVIGEAASPSARQYSTSIERYTFEIDAGLQGELGKGADVDLTNREVLGATLRRVKEARVPSSVMEHEECGVDMDCKGRDGEGSAWFMEVRIPTGEKIEDDEDDETDGDKKQALLCSYRLDDAGQVLFTPVLSYPNGKSSWSLCTWSGRVVYTKFVVVEGEEEDEEKYEYVVSDFLCPAACT